MVAPAGTGSLTATQVMSAWASISRRTRRMSPRLQRSGDRAAHGGDRFADRVPGGQGLGERHGREALHGQPGSAVARVHCRRARPWPSGHGEEHGLALAGERPQSTPAATGRRSSAGRPGDRLGLVVAREALHGEHPPGVGGRQVPVAAHAAARARRARAAAGPPASRPAAVPSGAGAAALTSVETMSHHRRSDGVGGEPHAPCPGRPRASAAPARPRRAARARSGTALHVEQDVDPVDDGRGRPELGLDRDRTRAAWVRPRP